MAATQLRVGLLQWGKVRDRVVPTILPGSPSEEAMVNAATELFLPLQSLLRRNTSITECSMRGLVHDDSSQCISRPVLDKASCKHAHAARSIPATGQGSEVRDDYEPRGMVAYSHHEARRNLFDSPECQLEFIQSTAPLT